MKEPGVMIDCVKNGCDPHHEDHGRITSYRDRRVLTYGIPDKANGHAVTYVEREIGPWEPAAPPPAAVTMGENNRKLTGTEFAAESIQWLEEHGLVPPGHRTCEECGGRATRVSGDSIDLCLDCYEGLATSWAADNTEVP